MRIHSLTSSRNAGFTIVELAVVIMLVGTLAGLVGFAYKGWQTSIAEKEVKSDLSMVVTAMKTQRNFANAYTPNIVPPTYKASENVLIVPTDVTTTAYCFDGISKDVSTVTMFVREDGEVKKGSCVGGEIIPGVGSTWTARAIAPSATAWRGITKGNGIFVAVGTNSGGGSTRATSTDGITWTARAGDEAESVTFGNGVFVSVDDTYGVSTSPNGITWTSRSAPAGSWKEVGYANGLFVAVGLNSATMTSPDGITWTTRTATSGAWGAVAYGNGLYVIASNTSQYSSTSPDGVTWTSRSMPSSSGYESIIFANNMFVAVGWNSIATSTDGITWTARTSPANLIWYSVTYGSGKFIAVGNTGGIMTSTDGITWTTQTSPASNPWQAVTYMNGKFVAVGSSGTNRLLTSP